MDTKPAVLSGIAGFCYISGGITRFKIERRIPKCYPAKTTTPQPSQPIALRNAGFGLQFGAAGDDFLNLAPNELGITVDPVPAGAAAEAVPAPDVPATGMNLTPPPADPSATKRELTAEEKFMQASSVLWPTKKHAGRTLGQVMQMDPSAIEWLANRYDRNPDVSAAAKYICEYALNHQSA